MHRVGVGEHVPVVGRSHRLAVRREILKRARLETSGLDDELVGHWEVPVDAPPDRELGHIRLDDVTETPDRHPAPVPAAGVGGRRGKEVPVLQRITERGVRDVVRRQRERVDAQTRGVRREGDGGVVENASSVQVRAIDFELHRNVPSRTTIDSEHARR